MIATIYCGSKESLGVKFNEVRSAEFTAKFLVAYNGIMPRGVVVMLNDSNDLWFPIGDLDRVSILDVLTNIFELLNVSVKLRAGEVLRGAD
jgi:hypothetical protein